VGIQKEWISRGFILCFISVFLTACASSRERFPNYGEVAKQNTTIPVVLDLFVYRDIKGKSRGVDSELTQRSIENAVLKINEKLSELGYETKFLATLNGVSHDIKEDREYLVAQGWKSTSEPYIHLDLDQSTNLWHSKQNKDFINALKLTARKMSPEEQISLLSELAVPSVIADDPEFDIIMFVLVDGFFQSTGKYLGQSLLIGGVSAALTGGTLITTGNGTRLTTDIIVFDKKTQKILWHDVKTGTRKSAVSNSIGDVLSGYPNTDGLTIWDRKKYREKKTKETNPK